MPLGALGRSGGRPLGDSSRAVPARPVQPQRFPARVVTFEDECGDEESGGLGEELLPEEVEGVPEAGDESEPQFEGTGSCDGVGSAAGFGG